MTVKKIQHGKAKHDNTAKNSEKSGANRTWLRCLNREQKEAYLTTLPLYFSNCFFSASMLVSTDSSKVLLCLLA